MPGVSNIDVKIPPYYGLKWCYVIKYHGELYRDMDEPTKGMEYPLVAAPKKNGRCLNNSGRQDKIQLLAFATASHQHGQKSTHAHESECSGLRN